jgi:hypothetical protein
MSDDLWRKSLERLQQRFEELHRSAVSVEAVMVELSRKRPDDSTWLQDIRAVWPAWVRVTNPKVNPFRWEAPHRIPVGASTNTRPALYRACRLYGDRAVVCRFRLLAQEAGNALAIVPGFSREAVQGAWIFPDAGLPEQRWVSLLFDMAHERELQTSFRAERMVQMLVEGVPWDVPVGELSHHRKSATEIFQMRARDRAYAMAVAAIPDPPDRWWSHVPDLAAASVAVIDLLLAGLRLDSTENEQRKRRGRPTDTDPKADAKVADAWGTQHYRTYADLGKELGMTGRDVGSAVERHRKRQKRANSGSD